MVNKPNYYGILPANIRYDEDITANAKLLYVEITALLNMNGKCDESSNYFAMLYGVSKVSIQKWLKQLEQKNYIHREIIYKKGSKEIETRYITIINHPSKQMLTTPSKQKLTVNNSLTDSNTNKTKVLDEEVKTFWNELAVKYKLAKVKTITPSRKKHLLARVKEVETFEEFKNLVEDSIANSSFLKGDNNRSWKVEFDWIIKPDNFIKVIENKYRDKNAPVSNKKEITPEEKAQQEKKAEEARQRLLKMKEERENAKRKQ